MNKETKLKNNLIVDYDKSVCSITNFEIDGQLGQSTIYESEDSHTITVYMPYDPAAAVSAIPFFVSL